MEIPFPTKDTLEQRNIFSFDGRIGRGPLWLTLLTFGPLERVTTHLFSISKHKIVFSTVGGYGEISGGYVTADSWSAVAAYYAALCAFAWVLIAAFVKRLHDLGQSGKWAAFIIGGITADIIFNAIFNRPGAPFSIIDAISSVTMVPLCMIGAFGILYMLFWPGITTQ